MIAPSPPRSILCVGDSAPAFSLPDGATGRVLTLANAFAAGPNVMLVFFRGTWCPFCREQMRVLTESQCRLDAAGIAVVGVVCQSAGSVRRFLEAHPLPFPLLVDQRRSVAKAYGVHYYVSSEGFNLARPSIFLLDTDRRITFAHVGRGMRDLPVTSVIERFVGFLDRNENEVAPPRRL